MPDTKTYKVGNDIYDIPLKEEADFLKENPKASEIQSYVLGKDTFDLPKEEVNDFLSENPTAKPLKKKDSTGVVSGTSSDKKSLSESVGQGSILKLQKLQEKPYDEPEEIKPPSKEDKIKQKIHEKPRSVEDFSKDFGINPEEIKVKNPQKILQPKEQEDLLSSVDFKRLLQQKNQEQNGVKPEDSYLWAFAHGINKASSQTLKTLDGAYRILNDIFQPSKYLEGKGENPAPSIFEKAANKIDENLQYAKTKTPQNVGGMVMEGLGSMAIDLPLMVATPETKLGYLEAATNGVIKSLPGIVPYMATTNALSKYQELDKQGNTDANKLSETFKAFNMGAGEGMAMLSFGFLSSKAGDFVKGITDSNVAGKVASVVSNGTLFGGMTGTEQFLSGKVNPQEIISSAILGAGMDLVMGKSLKENLEANQQKATDRFFTSSPDEITKINELPKTVEDLRQEQIKTQEKADKETDPKKKEELQIASNTLDGYIDIKAVSKQVVSDPDATIKAIQDDPNLSDQEKQYHIDKVNEVVANNDPRIQASKPLIKESSDIDRNIQSITENKSIPEENKPILIEGLEDRKKELAKGIKKEMSKPVDIFSLNDVEQLKSKEYEKKNERSSGGKRSTPTDETKIESGQGRETSEKSPKVENESKGEELLKPGENEKENNKRKYVPEEAEREKSTEPSERNRTDSGKKETKIKGEVENAFEKREGQEGSVKKYKGVSQGEDLPENKEKVRQEDGRLPGRSRSIRNKTKVVEEIPKFVPEGMAEPEPTGTKSGQVEIGEKTETPVAMKKILAAGDKNVFTREIKKDGKEFGEVHVEEKPEGWEVKYVMVNEKGKGYGKQIYRELNKQAQLDGKVVKSDRPDKISGAAKGLWDSLVKSGEAEKLPDNSYRMLSGKVKPEKTSKTVEPKAGDKVGFKDMIGTDRRGEILSVEEDGKYRIKSEDGIIHKVKPEKLEPVEEVEKALKERAKELADKIRTGKIDKDIVMAGVPFAKEIWNSGVEIVAKGVEAGGDIAQHISDALKYIKSTDWYKNLSQEDKDKAEKKFNDYISQEEFNPKEKKTISNYFGENPKTESSNENIKGVKRNLSNYLAFKDWAVRNANQLGKLSPELRDKFYEVASSAAQSSILIKKAISKISQDLGKEGWEDFRKSVVQSRLSGIKERWKDMSQSILDSPNEDVDNSLSSGLADLLDNIDARFGENNIKQAALALQSQGEYDLLKNYLSNVFKVCSDNVISVDFGNKNYDDIVKSENFKKALKTYKDLVEKPIAENHAKNEGVFSDALGELDTYYPLIPIDQQGNVIKKSKPYIKPANMANKFATGLSNDYDLSVNSLENKLRSSIRANNKADFIDALEKAGLIQKNPEEADFININGENFQAKLIPVETKYRTDKILMPKWLHDEIKPLLEKEDFDINDEKSVVGKTMGAITSFSLGGPFEAAFHSMNLIGGIVNATPYAGTDLISKTIGNTPITKIFTGIVNVLKEDVTSENAIKHMEEMSKLGLISPKTGSVTWSKKVAEETGAKKEPFWKFAPVLYGRKGVDVRARVLMDRIALEINPNATPEQRRQFGFQLGNYIGSAQGKLERFVKKHGFAPFYTAGSTFYRNGIKAMLGINPLPTEGQSIDKRILYKSAQLLSSGLVGVTAAWVVAYKAQEDKYPWEDKNSKLFRLPIPESIKKTEAGKKMFFRRGKWQDYGFDFANPVLSRGEKALGLPAMWKTWQAEGSKGQVFEAGELQALNSFMSPFVMSPPTEFAFKAITGSTPYITSLRDERGKPSVKFFNAVRTMPSGLQLPANIAEATIGINPLLENISESTGIGFSTNFTEEDRDAYTLLNQMYNLAFPRLFKPSSDVKILKQNLQQQQKSIESELTYESETRPVYQMYDRGDTQKAFDKLDELEQKGSLSEDQANRIKTKLLKKEPVYDKFYELTSKLDKSKKQITNILQSQGSDAALDYAQKNNLGKEYSFIKNNSSKIEHLQKVVNYLKKQPKDIRDKYEPDIKEDMKGLIDAFQNEDKFKISKQVNRLYNEVEKENKDLRREEKKLEKELK